MPEPCAILGRLARRHSRTTLITLSAILSRLAWTFEGNPLSLWVSGRFVLAARDSGFCRFEARSRVGSIAERFRRGAPTATQSKRSFGNRVVGSVPIHHRHVIALHQIRAVLYHLDRCHLSHSGSALWFIELRPGNNVRQGRDRAVLARILQEVR